MKKISKVFAGLALLGVASAAVAGTNTTPNTSYNVHQGVYMGAGVGASFGGSGSGLAGPAVNADIGYQFNRNFALEIGGSYAFPVGANADADFVPSFLGGSAEVDLYGVNLAAKAILPLGNRFSLFVKGGPALVVVHSSWNIKTPVSTSGSSNTTKPAVFLAGGASVAITHHLAVDMQVGGNIFSGGAYGIGGLGLSYHFG